MDRVRLLILEDRPADAELLLRHLRKDGVEPDARVVDGREAFAAALAEHAPELVLADYNVPGFDGLEALELVRAESPELPFIVVSGSIGEERAVDLLKQGVTDVVLKERPGRLGPAVRRALAQAAERRRRLDAERALRDTEDQLKQAHKMEAVGRLAGGIAHDFNNLLSAIIGFSELALRQVPAENPIHRHLSEVRKAGGRAAVLTRQLLAFSRQQPREVQVLDLNAVVRGIEELLRRLAGEAVRLTVTLAPSLGPVKADQGQLEQVLVNLVLNARDAMPTGGRVTIETQDVELDAQYARFHSGVEPGPYVMLAVSDTGVGMDADVRAQLFEPFFTTKKQGEGTGLGLASVYGIVKQSGGQILVYSEPGRGATFKVYLPRAAADAARAGLQPPATAPPQGGTEAVLLVEDDPGVRSLAAMLLSEAGYEVITTGRWQEAVRICEERTGSIDLLLTDVIMPEMSGSELAERVRRLQPNVRLLYMSGYPESAIQGHGILAPRMPFVPKPFTPTALISKVREVLDAPSA